MGKKISQITASTAVEVDDLFELETAAGNSRSVNERYLHPLKGALVTRTTNVSSANWTTATAVTWETATRDNVTAFSTNNPTRLQVPAGYAYARCSASLSGSGNTGDTYTFAQIKKTGSANFVGYATESHEVGGTFFDHNIQTAWCAVTTADYFEVFLGSESDTAVTLNSTVSWMQLELSN